MKKVITVIAIACIASIAAAEGRITIGSVDTDTKIATQGSVINNVRQILTEVDNGEVVVLERTELLKAIKEAVVRTGAFTEIEGRVFLSTVESMTLNSAITIFRVLALGENAMANGAVSYEVWSDLEDAEWRNLPYACGTQAKRRTRINVVSADNERGWDVEISRELIHLPVRCAWQ